MLLAVLIVLTVYLLACYGYGTYLLIRSYRQGTLTNTELQAEDFTPLANTAQIAHSHRSARAA